VEPASVTGPEVDPGTTGVIEGLLVEVPLPVPVVPPDRRVVACVVSPGIVTRVVVPGIGVTVMPVVGARVVASGAGVVVTAPDVAAAVVGAGVDVTMGAIV
jgi:hypothetical protein